MTHGPGIPDLHWIAQRRSEFTRKTLGPFELSDRLLVWERTSIKLPVSFGRAVQNFRPCLSYNSSSILMRHCAASSQVTSSASRALAVGHSSPPAVMACRTNCAAASSSGFHQSDPENHCPMPLPPLKSAGILAEGIILATDSSR